MFAEVFTEIRKKNGVGIGTLMTTLSMSGFDAGMITALSKMEHGKQAPFQNIETLGKIAAALLVKENSEDYNRFIEAAKTDKDLPFRYSYMAEPIMDKLPNIRGEYGERTPTPDELENESRLAEKLMREFYGDAEYERLKAEEDAEMERRIAANAQ